jgi:hypothetical protein
MLLPFLLLFILSSCRIEKRLYRSGFHITRSHHKPVHKDEVTVHDSPDKTIASAASEDMTMKALLSEKRKLLPPDTCDEMIWFKSGAFAKVKIVEETDSTVKYTLCNNNSIGKVHVSRKKNITRIQYKAKNTTEAEVTADALEISVPPVAHPLAIPSLIFMVLWVITLIVLWIPVSFTPALAYVFAAFLLTSLILSLIGLNQMKMDPGKYKDDGLLKTVLISDLVITGLIILLIISLGISGGFHD